MHYYGFDIGGTKIELAVFDRNLNCLWHKREATPTNDYDKLIAVLSSLVKRADHVFGTKRNIGIGVPGIINFAEGTVYTTNIPAIKGKAFISDLYSLLGHSIQIDNDANCFTLSESYAVQEPQPKMVLGLILGTGVGAGLTINNRPIKGFNGITGEIGHLRLTIDALNHLGQNIPIRQCNCGKQGCFELYLSGNAFAWLYEHFYQHQASAEEIIQQYDAKELSALEHVDRYSTLLAIFLGNILTILDPDRVVIGGGLSNFTALYPLLRQKLANHIYSIAKIPQIQQAQFGDAGGARGAAIMAIQHQDNEE